MNLITVSIKIKVLRLEEEPGVWGEVSARDREKKRERYNKELCQRK